VGVSAGSGVVAPFVNQSLSGRIGCLNQLLNFRVRHSFAVCPYFTDGTFVKAQITQNSRIEDFHDVRSFAISG
jgi:hypothetical protein